MTTVADAVAWLERRFPPALAEGWDTPGLAVGDPARPLTHVHFAVDPTWDVAREAVEAGAQLLVTHHPLMLRGVTSVAASTAAGAVVHALIEGGCALLAAHTNADAAGTGTNDALAAAIGMTSDGPLVPDAADPAVGSGRVGSVREQTLEDFATVVAAALPPTAGGVLYAGDPRGTVRRIAIVGGSGGSFLEDAVAAGVDAFVTADLRHHPATDAREAARLRGGKPYLVSVSHAASESLWLATAATDLAADLAVTVSVSTLNTDPWTGHVPSTR